MFFIDTRTAAERRADDIYDLRKKEARQMDPEPWGPDIKFKPSMKIVGDTYQPPSLFDVQVTGPGLYNPNEHFDNCRNNFAVSPGVNWAYRERVLPAGSVLEMASGRRRGAICFDSDVIIPMLHQNAGSPDRPFWRVDPIMSFTPLEYFSLRPGIRAAKGRVIIAGLGMGYMLEQVCNKENVTSVTLVEISQDLVEWIMPRINTHGVDVKIIIGDAPVIVPSLTADVALIDIFSTYGGNRDDWEFMVRHKVKGTAPRGAIRKTWIWGA